jgi:hypothetical protein
VIRPSRLAAALFLSAALGCSPARAETGGSRGLRLDLDALHSDVIGLTGTDAALDVQPPAAVAGRAVASGAPATGAEKEWTIMVFMDGKNNLAPDALDNVHAMERAVEPGDGFNVVVELGQLKKDGESGLILPGRYQWDGSRRYLILHNENPSAIGSLEFDAPDPTDPDISADPDMGDWHRLVDFAVWARLTFPAKKYMLIVWNHGGGWQGISFDDQSNNNISVRQLGRALDNVGRLDLYASDACLMQMADVVEELKDHAPVVVGSEEVEPGAGYDYEALLKKLSAHPQADAEELARDVVDSYGEYYAGGDDKVTQSAVRASAMDGLRSRLDAWTAAVMRAGERPALAEAQKAVLRFDDQDSADLYDLVSNVDQRSQDAQVRAAGRSLLDFLEKSLVIDAAQVGIPRAKGLAIYLPAGKYDEAHRKLAWAQDSHWDDFLRWLLAAGS